jgi:prevent-host-death family protein
VDSFSIDDAMANLSELITRAEAGEEIMVRRGSKPVAKIVRYEPPTQPRQLGLLEEQIHIAQDFDEIPEGFADYT